MKKRNLLFGLLAGLALVLGLWVYVAIHESRSVLPASVVKQANYAIWVPKDTQKYPVLEESVKHDTATKVLSYTTIINNKKITVNQQAEPETFKVPGAQVSLYEKLLDKMNQYQELTTDAGTVTLTHPTELNGGQAAVLNANGTLLFAQPVVNLTDSEWRDFFNDIRSLK